MVFYSKIWQLAHLEKLLSFIPQSFHWICFIVIRQVFSIYFFSPAYFCVSSFVPFSGRITRCSQKPWRTTRWSSFSRWREGQLHSVAFHPSSHHPPRNLVPKDGGTSQPRPAGAVTLVPHPPSPILFPLHHIFISMPWYMPNANQSEKHMFAIPTCNTIGLKVTERTTFWNGCLVYFVNLKTFVYLFVNPSFYCSVIFQSGTSASDVYDVCACH